MPNVHEVEVPVTHEVPVLQTSGLGRRFRMPAPWPRRLLWLDAVNDVNLSLGRGRTLGIAGESGCGKSTLSRMLVGILPPTAGRLCIDGVDVSQLRGHRWREVMRDVQMVFQSPYTALNPRLTIGEIVTNGPPIMKKTSHALPRY